MPERASTREHWESVYRSTAVERTGWYEAVPRVSLELIERCGLGAGDMILDMGSGASRLVDELLARGHERVAVADVSGTALATMRARLGEQAEHVTFIEGDIRDTDLLAPIAPVALWHDRALLHFLVDDEDRAAYSEAVKSTVVPGGHVILAAYAPHGADH